MSAAVEIERLSQRRQEIWFSGSFSDSAEVDRITSRLHILFESKRHEICQATHGRRRLDIIKRARVESELERLMSERSR